MPAPAPGRARARAPAAAPVGAAAAGVRAARAARPGATGGTTGPVAAKLAGRVGRSRALLRVRRRTPAYPRVSEMLGWCPAPSRRLEPSPPTLPSGRPVPAAPHAVTPPSQEAAMSIAEGGHAFH